MVSATNPPVQLQSACDQRRGAQTHLLSLKTPVDIIRSRRLRLFGHIARADPLSDHRRALYSTTHGSPADWTRSKARLQHTCTGTVEADLRPANIGIHTAWQRAQDREA